MNERTFYCFLYTWSHRVNYKMLKKNLRDIILINASSTLLVLLTLPYTVGGGGGAGGGGGGGGAGPPMSSRLNSVLYRFIPLP